MKTCQDCYYCRTVTIEDHRFIGCNHGWKMPGKSRRKQAVLYQALGDLSPRTAALKRLRTKACSAFESMSEDPTPNWAPVRGVVTAQALLWLESSKLRGANPGPDYPQISRQTNREVSRSDFMGAK